MLNKEQLCIEKLIIFSIGQLEDTYAGLIIEIFPGTYPGDKLAIGTLSPPSRFPHRCNRADNVSI